MHQGGAPEWTLVLWIWEKSKVQATIKASPQPNQHINQCLFNPQDASLISVRPSCMTHNIGFRSVCHGDIRRCKVIVEAEAK